MLTLDDGRNELWQWDTRRTLSVPDDCSQVHFSNKVFGRSIDVDVVDGVASIPDILLQTDKELTAWAFVGTPENGYTKISKVFKVNKRNKPADYVFTPPDQTSIEEIKEKLEYLESIQDPDAIKNAVEDYLEKNPVEAPVQSVNGKLGEVELTADDVGAISQDALQKATNEALAQAKASGEFNGDPGKDGTSAAHSWNGTVLTITSASGTSSADLKGEQGIQGIQGIPGNDYVLTEADKAEIAELAAELVEVPESSGGGLTATASELLITILRNGLYSTDQSANITALAAELGVTEENEPDEPVVPDEPEKTLTSISAIYSGGSVTAGTAVSDLAGIAVTAHYSDGTSEAVTGYTLSGTIAEGSNTITVSYGGMTTTFTVTGVAESGGEETGVSNETTWTNGVAYTFEPIANEYPDKLNGSITAYNNWNRSPHLYCAGASILRGVVKTKSSQFAGTKDNAFYDADKNYVAPLNSSAFAFSSLSNAEVGTYYDVQIPENAAYFIVSGNTTMLPIDGEQLIEYVPYE